MGGGEQASSGRPSILQREAGRSEGQGHIGVPSAFASILIETESFERSVGFAVLWESTSIVYRYGIASRIFRSGWS